MTQRPLNELRLEQSLQFRRHRIHRSHAVDPLQHAFGVVVADQRRGLLIVFAQALLENFRRIILADRPAGCLRLLGALDDPMYERFVVDQQLDDRVDLVPRSFSMASTEDFGLLKGARVTIKDKPLGAILLIDSLRDNRIHDIV